MRVPLAPCLALVSVVGLSAAAGHPLQRRVAPETGDPGAWTQFRGATRDSVVHEFSEPSPWPETLEKVWSTPVGAGYASPIASGGKLYLHTRVDQEEVVSALDFATGQMLWNDKYPAPSTKTPEFAASEGEGPYSTPILHSGRLYTVGVNGVVSSYEAEGGELLWRRDFSALIVSTVRFCGTASSPLIVDDRIIVHIGDDDTGQILSLDTETGTTQWSWGGPGPGNASPNVMELDGERQLVTMTDRSVVGLDIEDGRLLWQLEFPAPRGSCSLNIPTPVVHGRSIIVSAMDRGTVQIELVRSGGNWTPRPGWKNEEIAPLWSSLVADGDEMFGISQRRKGQLFSLDARTGEMLWSGEGRAGENGFVVDAGDVVLFLMNEGDLLVARKTRPGLELEIRYTVADTTVWSHPIVWSGGILIKDKATLTRWSFESGRGDADALVVLVRTTRR